jgi:hypothetical protein
LGGDPTIAALVARIESLERQIGTVPPTQHESHLWSQAFVGGATVWDAATDADGNIVVTGTFAGQVDFGGAPLSSQGNDDAFVAKFARDGSHLWSRGFGGLGSDSGYGLATDKNGNVLVTGSFSGQLILGSSVLHESRGPTDIFIMKLAPDGSFLWSRQSLTTNVATGYGIASDPMGNVLVTGSFAGVSDITLGPLASIDGSADILVAKYSPDGVHLWSKLLGGTNFDGGFRVGSDATGNVLVSGHFDGSVDFGGGLLVSPVLGLLGAFVAKLDQNGAHLWSMSFDGTGVQEARAMAVEANGNVLLAGAFSGTLEIGATTLTSTFSSRDIFVAKFSSSGVPLWSTRMGGDGFSRDTALGVACDASGNVVVTGFFEGTADFGGESLVAQPGSSDVFVAQFTPDGAHLWAKAFGSTAADEGRAIAKDADGKVIVAGQIVGTVEFGGGTRGSLGLPAIFLLKLDPLEADQ